MKRNKRFSVVHLAILFLWLCAAKSTYAQCTIDDSKILKAACAEQIVDLTGISPTGGTWYHYSSGDMPNATTFSQNYSGTATLTYVASVGCEKKIDILITNKVVFYSTPSIPASMCASSQEVNLSASVPQGITVTAYIDNVAETTLKPSVVSAGNHSVKWIGVSQGGCKDSVTKTFTIASPAAPTVTDRTVNQADGQISLSATGSSPSATFKWWKKNGTTYAETQSTVDVSQLQPGVYEFQVAEISGTCEGAKATLNLTVLTSCTLAAPSVNKTLHSVCNINDAELTASGVQGATIIWFDNANLTGTGTATSILSPSVAGKYYAVQVSGCQSPATEVTVTVIPKPSAPTTADVTACEGSVYKLTAQGNNIQWWSNSSATGSPLAAGADFKPSQAGTYYATQADGTCMSTTAAAVLTLNQAPVAALKADLTTVCAGAAVTLTVNGNGQWFGTTPTATNNTTYTYTSSSAQIVRFGYIESAGLCTDTAFVDVAFISKTTPTLSAQKTTVCTQDIIALNPSPTGGVYSVTGATAVGDHFSTQVAGTYTVTYTVGKGTACEASTTLDITAVATPNAIVYADKAEYCQGQTVSITTSNNGQLRYPAGLTADGQGNYSFVATNTGTQNIEYIAINGACSDTAKTSVVVKAKANITLNITDAACTGELVSVFANPMGGVFETSAGKVNASGTSFVSSTDGTIDVSYIVDKGAVCESKLTKQIVISAAPKATVSVSKSSVCVGEKVIISTSDNGAFDEPATTVGLGNGSYEYTVATAGTHNIVYVSSGNNCTDTARTTVTTNGSATPISFTLQATACVGDKITLSATPANGVFETSAAGLSGSDFTPTTSGTASISYIVGKGSACESKETKSITVNAKPIAAVSLDKTSICAGGTVVITTSDNGTLTKPQGLTANAGVYQYTPTTTGTYDIEYVATVGSCSSTATSQLSVLNNGSNITFDLPTTACSADVITLGATPAGGTYSTTVGSVSNSSLSFTDAGSGQVTYTLGSGACESKVTKDIVVTKTPVITFNPSATSICTGQSLALSATPAGGSFTTSIGSVANNALTSSVAGDAEVTYTAANGSCQSKVSKTIKISESAAISFIPSATTICAGQSLSLSATPAGGEFQTSLGTISNSALISDIAGTASVSYTVNKGTACETKETKSITIQDLTSITFAPAASVCAGIALPITASPDGGVFEASIGTISNGSFISTTTGTASLTYIIGKGTACESKKTQSVEVLYTPVAPTITTSSLSLPIGTASAQFTASIATSNTVNYLWLNKDGVELANTATLTLNTTNFTAGTTTYTVSAKSFSCQGPSSSASLTITAAQLDLTFLNAAIKAATDTLAIAKPGTAIGEYPADAISTLKAARDDASAAVSTLSTQAAVLQATNTLKAAISAFAATKILVGEVNRTALGLEIDKALDSVKLAVPGNLPGQYPQSAITAINDAIVAAKNEYTKTVVTVASIKAATETLAGALSTFLASKIGIIVDKSELSTLITSTNTPIAQYKDSLGLGDGQYSSSQYQSVLSAQTKAKEVLSNTLATQMDVIIAVAALQTVWESFLTSQVVVDRSTLATAISDADYWLVVARVNKGVTVNSYPAAAVATYETAFTTANVVFNKKNVTQAEIASAVKNLNIAVKNLQNSIITSVAVQSIDVPITTLTMYKGEKLPIVYTVQPRYASNKKVVFSIDNETVVSIADNQIVANEYGSTTFTIKALGGMGVQSVITINVVDPLDVSNPDAKDITVLPSVTKDGVIVNLSKYSDANLTLVSESGATKTFKLKESISQIALDGFANGVYQVVIENKGIIIKTTSIVKQ